jgi:DNA repair exonuclease SbcCD ATPase subunit
MITFKKVRFKNFGSFGNTFTELELDKKPSVLVCGSNGNGKSFALLDSITFALFGKPFRNINIPQLVNTINKKECLVELELEINKVPYLIRRGLSPKVFEIYENGTLINQSSKTKDYQEHLENNILHMTYKSFTQVVILGKASFIPFMQLTAADRRAVIENILDIGVFSEMNVVLKEKISQMKTRHQTLESKIEVLKEKERLLVNYINNIKKKNEEDMQGVEDRIKEVHVLLKGVYEDREKLKKELDDLKTQSKDTGIIQKSLNKLHGIEGQISENVTRLSDQIKFFNDTQVCNVCSQDISDKTKHTCISNNTKKIEELKEGMEKLKENIQNHTNDLEAAKEIENKIRSIELKIATLDSRYDGIRKEQDELYKKVNNPPKDDSEEERKNLEKVVAEKTKLTNEIKRIIEDGQYYEVIGGLLKDSGIKAKIIKHYLPIINKLINKYLSAMDFFVKFNLDEEFKESIKSRHRDDFSYESFSEGEKMRIDLSLLLCWREIARMKNSVSCNLLILDEVFDSSLDSGGTEEFMKLLKSLGTNSNIFIISHKTDQLIDKFPNILTFEKKNNFSKMIATG